MRGVGSMATSGMSGKAVGGLMFGAAAVGGISTVGSAAVDASMDVAFGAPDADKFFVGEELSSRYLLGRAIGGPVGTMMQATDPSAAITFSGGEEIAAPRNMAIGGIAGTAVGGGVGAGVGAALGGFSSNPRGKLAGAIIGGIFGATAGGAAGATQPLRSTAELYRDNRAFFSETAYGRSRSAQNAMALNAVGDIVLGMHNSRRSY